MPLSNAIWMVAILSPSSFTGPPQTEDMRMQPNPSLDTSGPFLPRAIFVIVDIVVILWINDTKIDDSALWPISLMAQFTCLDGSPFMVSRSAEGGSNSWCCILKTLCRMPLSYHLFITSFRRNFFLQSLENNKQHRYNKYTQDHPRQHAPHSTPSNGVIALRRRPLRKDQGKHAHDKRKRGHQY